MEPPSKKKIKKKTFKEENEPHMQVSHDLEPCVENVTKTR